MCSNIINVYEIVEVFLYKTLFICCSEERILSFFKTIQSQYPLLQKYFEDLLIDIIGEISEAKKEHEKLEHCYKK